MKYLILIALMMVGCIVDQNEQEIITRKKQYNIIYSNDGTWIDSLKSGDCIIEINKGTWRFLGEKMIITTEYNYPYENCDPVLIPDECPGENIIDIKETLNPNYSDTTNLDHCQKEY